MSSFIIEKEEYVKAAGLVAGSFGEGYSRKRDCISSYWYDRILGQFYNLYLLNVESYNLQYSTLETPDPLNDSDKQLYEEYKLKGIAISNSEKARQELIFNLNRFFRSVNYQIEDKDCDMKASKIMFVFMSCMIASIKFDDKEWWGSIKLEQKGDNNE